MDPVTGGGSQDLVVAVVIAPLLFFLMLPALSRQANREGDRRLFAFLAAALVVKLVATLVRYYVTFYVYDTADASGYHEWGVRLSERFRDGDFSTEGLKGALISTNFIRLFTGIVYTIIGPSTMGGFLVYSWLGFIGLYYFYRGFVIAVPDGRTRSYGKFVFFLPTLLYWPSSIGKESWMMFGLGIASYGAARLLSGSGLRGAGAFAIGIWLTGLVRPHMAGLVGVALATAYVIRRPSDELRELGPVVKFISAALLSGVAVFLVIQGEQFIEDKGVSTAGGVEGIVEGTSDRTAMGSSEFAPPSVFESPALAPLAIATVLFRPLLIEANNGQALIAGLETTFLLLITLKRLPWAWGALKSVRRRGYVAYAAIYAALFVIAFSGIANFGLLVRQRAQLLPLYLVLFCIPVRRAQEEEETDEEDALDDSNLESDTHGPVGVSP